MKIFPRSALWHTQSKNTHNCLPSFLFLPLFNNPECRKKRVFIFQFISISSQFTLTAWELAADWTGRGVLRPGGADRRPLSCPQVWQANRGDGRHLLSALTLHTGRTMSTRVRMPRQETNYSDVHKRETNLKDRRRVSFPLLTQFKGQFLDFFFFILDSSGADCVLALCLQPPPFFFCFL